MKNGASRVNLIKIASLLVVMLSVAILCSLIFRIFNPSNVWYVIFLAVSLLALWILVGTHFRRSVDGGVATQIVVVYVLLYLVLIFLMGLATGFLRNGYSMAPLVMLKNVSPIIAATILIELLRYSMVKRIGDSKLALVGIIMSFSIITIIVGLAAYNLSAPVELYEMLGILVLGGIATNTMLTFVAWKSDWRPIMAYSLMMATYPVVLPILPDLGSFLYSVLAILLPMLLFIRFNEFFVTRRPIPGRSMHRFRKMLIIPPLIVLCAVVVLVSGVFRYWALAIGSDSMLPAIRRGDVVVIDKSINQIDNIEAGEIVAFERQGRVITHRVVDIKHSNNGLQIQTRGDNNNANDPWAVEVNDIIGVVKCKIPLVGWPTVWLGDTFGRGARE